MAHESVYKQILDAVQAKCKQILLTGMTASNVVVQKVPSDRTSQITSKTGVLISPFGSPNINPRGGTNASDDISYPVVIILIQPGNQDQITNMNRFLLWQQKVRRTFIHQRLAGVSEVYTCFVEPRDAFNPSAWLSKNLDASGMVLRFMARESRGA